MSPLRLLVLLAVVVGLVWWLSNLY